MVDPQRVRTKLTVLERYVSLLAAMPTEVGDHERVFARRYLVQGAIQICIDIANHLVASEGWAPARDFREAFTRLEEEGVLDTDLAGRLRDATGLRNRLVHLYDDVDDAVLAQESREGLPDFEAFARAIAERVDDDAVGPAADG